MTIFDEIGQPALHAYLRRVANYRIFDHDEAYRLAMAAIRYYGGNASAREELSAGQALEARWYASIATGAPDYTVYDDEFFISDVWACWIVYSRKYLRALRPLVSTLEVMSVADLGCGFGYTTAALKELFPAAAVYGTQLPGTFQYETAEAIGRERDFHVQSVVTEQTGLIFASEYFEHFERPVEHLADILTVCQPRYLVIANSFGSRSIGHFDSYRDGEEHVSNKMIGRRFNANLRQRYDQLATGFWNNRPAVWVSKEHPIPCNFVDLRGAQHG